MASQLIRRPSRGIILPVVFALTVLMLVLVIAMGTLNVQTLSSAATEVYARQARYAADAGVQAALSQLSANSALTGPINATLANSGFAYSVQITNNSAGITAVTAPDGTSVPAGYVWVKSTGTSQYRVSRSTVALVTTTNPVFSNALFALGDVSLSGGAAVDAYNSNNGPYVAPTTAQINAPVGSSDGTITISGSKTSVDGNILLGSGATLSGSGYTGTVVSNASLPSHPSVTAPTVSGTPAAASSSGTLAPGTYSSLSVSGGNTVTLQAGTYYFTATGGGSGTVSLSGNSTLVVSSGPVIIYVDGSFDASGGTLVNSTMLPSNLQIYGTPSASKIKISGGSNAAMAVYAPTADVTITGGGQIYGAVYGQSVTNSGGSEIHYDLALQNLNTAGVSGTSGAWKMSGMYHP